MDLLIGSLVIVSLGRSGGRRPLAAARELETAARLAAAVVVVVFDDCGAGAPDSMKLARDSGVRAFAADSEGKFAEALGRTLRTGGPAVIAVRP